MKMSTCPKCGRAAWHKTHAALVERKPIYETIVGEDGKTEKIKVGDEVRVLKPSQIKHHTCKRHSPRTKTHESQTRSGPRHRNRKSMRTHAR